MRHAWLEMAAQKTFQYLFTVTSFVDILPCKH